MVEKSNVLMILHAEMDRDCVYSNILKQTEFLLVMLYSGILLLIGSTYNVAFIDFLSMLKYKYIML